MDLIEILGELLGQKKASPPGRPANIPGDSYKTGSGGRTHRRDTGPLTDDEIERQASELEDLLNVAKNRTTAPPSAGVNRPAAGEPRPAAPPRVTPSSPPSFEPAGVPDNDRAEVLIRAMVNAAKSDGQIDQAEQQKILGQLNNPDRSTVDFLRRMFNEPLDVRQFADSVPVGMEKQVYMMSLMALDLDSSSEAKYLMNLGNALRLSQEEREQIHQRMGAPSVY
jgi:hypothetical protein